MWQCRPSELLGLESGSYEAYCLDQAVGYLCSTVEHELENAGQKPSKEEKKARTARERILTRYMSGDDPKKRAKSFADPAAFFK